MDEDQDEGQDGGQDEGHGGFTEKVEKMSKHVFFRNVWGPLGYVLA